MGLKDMFSSKDKQKASSSSSSEPHPLSQPILTPGIYGQFPSTFSIYFVGRAADQKADGFLIADSSNGQLKPLNAVTAHKGMVKLQLVLHSGPNRDYAPLSLTGTEKFFRSAWVFALPSPTAGPGVVVNQYVQLVDAKRWTSENWSFSVPVGADQHIESFEWRSDNILKPVEGKPFERRLVRLSTSGKAADQEDILARWIYELTPEKESKLGTTHFQGSGATGELGPLWTLAAVTTLLRITQAKWEAGFVVDGMLEAAARLADAGLGFAM